MGAVHSRYLKQANDPCWASVQNSFLSFLVSSMRGEAIAAKLGMNDRLYPAKPKKERAC